MCSQTADALTTLCADALTILCANVQHDMDTIIVCVYGFSKTDFHMTHDLCVEMSSS